MLRRSRSEEVALSTHHLEAHINLGSNLGDRMANIDRAVALIQNTLHCPVERSAPYHSQPWGFASPNQFVNVAVVAHLPDDTRPIALLEALQRIERAISPLPHRNAAGGYIDRLIDIDIIAIDEIIFNHPRLRLPHPRMHLRDFVVRPLAELRPGWKHPVLHLTASEMCDNCG